MTRNQQRKQNQPITEEHSSDWVSGRALPPHDIPLSLWSFIFRVSGFHQLGLASLSGVAFLLSTIPLELQRRIVNDAFKGGSFRVILDLAIVYVALALAEGALKIGMNVYRSWVSERAVQTLRRTFDTLLHTQGTTTHEALGIETSMMLSEAEPVGNFTGISISEPMLQGGILVAVFGYMIWLEPTMALVGLGVFSPQLFIVPLLQASINRRVAKRIETLRAVSVGIITDPSGKDIGVTSRDMRIDDVFHLNMGVHKLKFTMNFIMNLLHHIGTASILAIGGWFVVRGETEIGTVIAFVSGLAKINDPWGDVVNWYRDLMVTRTKYQMIAIAVRSLALGRAS